MGGRAALDMPTRSLTLDLHSLTPCSATPLDTWLAENSSAGQRALTLSTQAGAWSVVPAFGQPKSSSAAMKTVGGERGGCACWGVHSACGAAAACRWPHCPAAAPTAGSMASVTPLRVAGESVVLEGTVVDGSRHEVLRSLCQVRSPEMGARAFARCCCAHSCAAVTRRAERSAYALLPLPVGRQRHRHGARGVGGAGRGWRLADGGLACRCATGRIAMPIAKHAA